MPRTEQLYAGFAKADITPTHPRGMTLLGMGRVYPGAEGVLDPIMVRATYVGTKTQGALLIVLDAVFPTVIVPHEDEVITALADATGLPKARIWILCTHCHSSFGEAFYGSLQADHYRVRILSQFMDGMIERVVATGLEAYRSRRAAEIGYAAAPVSGVGSNRRIKTSDGIAITYWANGPCPQSDMRIVDRGVHDPDVGLVVFRDQRSKRPFGAIINYNSHIHLYPTQHFTAELAGEVVRKLEKKHPGLLAVYTNGSEGTTSLDIETPPQSLKPTDWDSQYIKYREKISARMEKGLEAAWKKLSFNGKVRMRCGETEVSMHIIDTDGVERDIVQPLKALAIDDLALVGEQEEAWAEFSLDVKAGSPFPSTFVLGFVGFRNRYFPTAHGIEEGSYESQIRYLDGDGFARTVRGAVDLLGTLRQEARS